jgi:dTDP-4-amino-4,6-dideoxygalactose transaminase
VDIRPTDLNIDPDLIEAAISPRTRVILPVHVFGTPCDMTPILKIADRHGLDVIEDMAQAFGTFYAGQACGSFGRLSCLSFYPTKNLAGIGDGGMVMCHNLEDAANLRLLRGHDPIRLNGRLHPGWNSRLDELQSLVVRIRLSRFASEQQDRNAVASIYCEHIPAVNRLREPDGGQGVRATYHQYWVRTPLRDQLRQHLTAHGIETGIYYDPPLHRHPLGEYCRTVAPLAEAERAGAEVLTLPIHPALPLVQARRIARLVQQFLQKTALGADKRALQGGLHS